MVAVFCYILLWSSGFIPSRVLLTEMSPLWAAVIRLALAGGILLLVAWCLRVRFPRGLGEWRTIVAIGFCTNVIYLALLYVALRHLSAGMSAIIASTNPLVLALLAPAFLGERATWPKTLGLLVGFAGVTYIITSRAGIPTEAFSDEAIAFVSVLGLVASTILFRRLNGHTDVLAVTALQLAFGAAFLLGPAIVFEGTPALPHTAYGWDSMVYLVLVMSVGASLLWFWLLRNSEASTVSAYYFLTPVFGLALSWLILRERLTLSDALGAIAIAVGIAVVQRTKAPAFRRD